ncbi:hypothetical protein SUGI_0269330 [Cryptomeria japonica]|nr:hypothetical protein SUGI_0269330 [Cryptomeria japonica]
MINENCCDCVVVFLRACGSMVVAARFLILAGERPRDRRVCRQVQIRLAGSTRDHPFFKGLKLPGVLVRGKERGVMWTRGGIDGGKWRPCLSHNASGIRRH